MSGASGDTWLPDDDAHSRNSTDWSEADAWPRPEWPGAAQLVTPPDAINAGAAEMMPFELPEPTTLEQRGVIRADGDVDDDADIDDEFEMEDLDDDPEEDELTMETEGEAIADPTDAEDDEADAPITSDRSAGASIGRDPLTGMLDAAAFEEVMGHEEAREQRYGRPATVIVFELDGLMKLVDRLGAEPGDRIETALGDTIKRLARRADHVARLERGRYAVLLPETDEVAAINYVERIRRACDLWLESGAIAMRLAIGWASTNGDSGLTGAVRAATERMRLEQRRNARSAGDVALDVEGRNGHEQIEAISGI